MNHIEKYKLENCFQEELMVISPLNIPCYQEYAAKLITIYKNNSLGYTLSPNLFSLINITYIIWIQSNSKTICSNRNAPASLEADEQERDSRRVKVVGRLTAIHVKCTETLPQRKFFNSRSQPGKHLLINTCYPIQSGGSSISTFTYRSFTQFDCYS